MKKYPITYKNELYEVRWETLGWFNFIFIYKETTSKLLKRKIYKQIYYEYEDIINNHIKNISKNDPTFYIEQAKTIFKRWEQSESYKINQELIEQNKQQTLAEWDGVIE